MSFMRDTGALGVLELAERLEAIPEENFSPERVTRLLQDVRVQPESLAPYLLFDAAHYTRNLVFRCERFELLSLCWEPGQRSMIHNHAGQQCWMMVPLGRLLNQNYRVLQMDDNDRTCQLEEAARTVIDPDHPLQVDPREPIHQVLNLPDYAERAVSLHIYSHPYDRCLVYSLETGRFGEIELKCNTRFGRPV
jgi:cysteine dioxygenase